MRFALLTVMLIVAGCGSQGPTGTDDNGGPGYRVQLHNGGTATLRNLRVVTGENVPPLTIAELGPGASSGVAQVPVLHEQPYVSLTINSRNLVYQPTEGFGGFNAQLAPGSYVIRLTYVVGSIDGLGMLDVRTVSVNRR